jgi:transcriptional regulator with XRE-family HTH domain
MKEGLTQDVVAKRAKVHPTHISYLENGRLSPNYTTLVRLSDGFGIRLSEWIALAEEVDRKRGPT